jgi:hypothetical protein
LVRAEIAVRSCAVELRNDQHGIENPAGFDGLGKRRPRSMEGVFNQVIGAL